MRVGNRCEQKSSNPTTDAERAMSRLEKYKGDNPWQDIFYTFDLDAKKQERIDPDGAYDVFFSDRSALRHDGQEWQLGEQESSNPLRKKVTVDNEDYIMSVKKVKETGKFEVEVKNQYDDVQDWDVSSTEHESFDDAETAIFDWIQEQKSSNTKKKW